MKHTSNRTRHSSSSGATSFGVGDLLRHCLLGVAPALAAAFLLALIGAALCLRAEDPPALTVPVGTVLLYACAVLAGLLGARLHRCKFLLCGLISGICLLVFFWGLTLFLPEAEGSGMSFLTAFLLRLLLLPCSCLGALLGGQRKLRHRRRR